MGVLLMTWNLASDVDKQTMTEKSENSMSSINSENRHAQSEKSHKRLDENAEVAKRDKLKSKLGQDNSNEMIWYTASVREQELHIQRKMKIPINCTSIVKYGDKEEIARADLLTKDYRNYRNKTNGGLL